ncbi:hypothetical protein C7S20_01575 [Christiangramia fulva]|uniref:Uncharacterized protein n=1 Tax=Christiangramia fulva TaxID=2126553 RepID=A0A2R3Z1C8_9FLAO|nr:hypothetical protein [Christiangramia fulva]AVR44054.1 hypothetical protein C7S20_01575 [Christiangramia fulva]
MKKFILLFSLSLFLLSCNDQKQKEKKLEDMNEPASAADKIAFANGIKKFDSIKKLEFTFNVEVNDTIRSKRHWAWHPDTHKITLTEKDTVMSYIKKDSLSEKDKKIDRKFVNDTYWLLFPFQLEWSNAEISEVKKAQAPISGEEMKMMSVNYPSQGGYTPGDTYDIYFNDDYMIQEWVYKPSGGGNPLATTWEDYHDFEGIKIAREHKGKDGNFKIFFSDISAE